MYSHQTEILAHLNIKRGLSPFIRKSRDSQRLSDYLGHILEAIERIVRYTENMDEVQFL